MNRCSCATHGHCFDGLSSAAIFSEVLHAQKPSSFHYQACGYNSATPRPPRLDGDDNALLDYRYVPDSALTFYFDHHPTAFRSAEDEQHFQKRQAESPTQFAVDRTSTSCAQLIARHAKEHFGIDLPRFEDLIRWAEKMDGALFESVSEATNREHPVLRLAAVIEQFGDSAFLNEAIPLLRKEGLEALAAAPFVKKRYRGLAPKYEDYVKRVHTRGRLEEDVAIVDLSEAPVTVIAKFSQYAAFPEARYSAILAQMGSGFRLSIGFNPWADGECTAHLGNICARYGGGGHAVVGGVALGDIAVEKAQALLLEVASELAASPKHRTAND